MWMVLHVDDAVYTEYDQLRHVKVSVVDEQGRCVVRKREIDALAAEGIVSGIVTDRSMPMSVEYIAQVCRDHAPAIHTRYVAAAIRGMALSGDFSDVERDGMLSEVRCRIHVPRSTRIFA